MISPVRARNCSLVSFIGLPFQTAGFDDEAKVRRRKARNVIETFDKIPGAGLFFGKIRYDDEVFTLEIFGERMLRVVSPGQFHKRIAFHPEKLPKFLA